MIKLRIFYKHTMRIDYVDQPAEMAKRFDEWTRIQIKRALENDGRFENDLYIIEEATA